MYNRLLLCYAGQYRIQPHVCERCVVTCTAAVAALVLLFSRMCTSSLLAPIR